MSGTAKALLTTGRSRAKAAGETKRGHFLEKENAEAFYDGRLSPDAQVTLMREDESPTSHPRSSSSSCWLSEEKLAVEIEKLLSPDETATLQAAYPGGTRARINEALRSAVVRFAKDQLLQGLGPGEQVASQSDPIPLEDPGGEAGDAVDDETIFHTRFSLSGPGKPMIATRKREHRIVKLHPVEKQRSAEMCDDGSIIIRDEDRLFDRVYTRCPCLYKTSFTVYEFSLPVVGLLFLPFLATAPFAILSFTDTSATLFGTNTSGLALQAGNRSLNTSTGSSAQALPWPEAWEQASLWITALFCVVHILLSALDFVIMSSTAMLRRIATVHWTGMIPNIGFSWAYMVVAAMIQPNPWHICWLICLKGNMPVVMYFYDAIAVGTQLRAHPQFFTTRFGKDDIDDGKKSGNLVKLWGQSASIIIPFTMWIGLDIMRHYLVVNFGENFALITIQNPISDVGKSFSWGASELASLFYWSSTLFFVQSFWAQLTSKTGRQTTVDSTNYEIISGTSWRSRSVRLHDGSSREGRMGTALVHWKRSSYR